MTHDEMIAVIQAAKDGKVIESTFNDGLEIDWSEDTEHQKDGFDFQSYIYRIKPEPRSLWVVRYENGKRDTVWDEKQHAEDRSKYIKKSTIHEYKEVLP